MSSTARLKASAPAFSIFTTRSLRLTSLTTGPSSTSRYFSKTSPHRLGIEQLDLGGTSTSGMTRRASLRTMQKAIKIFLGRTKILRTRSADEAAQIVLDFWTAVALVLAEPWLKPRKSPSDEGDRRIRVDGNGRRSAQPKLRQGHAVDKRYFASPLADFAVEFDWSTEGPLKGLGGEGGVKTAVTPHSGSPSEGSIQGRGKWLTRISSSSSPATRTNTRRSA